MSTKVAVLGAGNGAFAMAGDLALKGFAVAMWSSRIERLEAIRASKTIQVVGPTVQGQARLSLVTGEIAAALDGADVICMPVPAFSQREAAELLAPHVRDGQVIFLAPGTFGTYLMAKRMWDLGCRAEFAICETGTLPYLTRKTRPDESSIVVRACHLPTGVFPGRLTDMAIGKLRQVVPSVHAVEDALSGALMNAGPIIHPPLVVMNTGPIENQPAYDIHNEGTSPGIRLVQRRLDAERIVLREALGYAPNHYPLEDYYDEGAEREWMYPRASKKLLMASRLWNEKVDYAHRYVTEDIQLGLAFLVSVARCAGIELPTASALLTIAGAVVGTDYLQTGRTLGSLGLAELTPEELQRLLQDGFTGATT
ncbi:MAG TPA: NAD/NADP octopine/nopaline dehydrogenase family protein [Deferrisomatales bacterium]|nr:NAD/NADP octopine/nopaline dehydrogenase family protein [Deferrisomatales bacterium]